VADQSFALEVGQHHNLLGDGPLLGTVARPHRAVVNDVENLQLNLKWQYSFSSETEILYTKVISGFGLRNQPQASSSHSFGFAKLSKSIDQNTFSFIGAIGECEYQNNFSVGSKRLSKRATATPRAAPCMFQECRAGPREL
jgi:hypothetical protein